MEAGFDWAGFEDALVDGAVNAVRSTVVLYPSERIYAAALDRVYRETDGVITLPHLATDSAEALARRRGPP